MDAKITLVMPCYNGLKYITHAIDSVLAQSFRDWELLVGDDGSKDGTVEYLLSLSDERIKVFIHPRNLGIFGNLNFLFSRAKCPITQILCQDDYLIGRDALKKILSIWSELPEEIAFLRCNHGRDGTSPLMRLEQEVLPMVVQPKDSDLFFFLFGCIPGNLSNVSVRTQVIEKMGWYRTDLPYAGDFEFWSRTGRARPWALNGENVVKVRAHPEQASRTLNKKGELLPQLREVIAGLSEQLLAQGYASYELRWFAATAYVARQIHGGVMVALRGGGWGYLNTVIRLFCGGKYFLGRGLTWLAYLTSVGGRFLGPAMAKRLVSRHVRLARS